MPSEVKQTPVRLPDELRARARAHCAKSGMSLSFLIRLALIDYLDRQQVAPHPVETPQPKPIKDDDMLDFGGE
jgi:antitoxin component of RelBE/YafQ-DinJ toxin-antitoxin module